MSGCHLASDRSRKWVPEAKEAETLPSKGAGGASGGRGSWPQRTGGLAGSKELRREASWRGALLRGAPKPGSRGTPALRQTGRKVNTTCSVG